ncbi:MAG: hypothetical protein EP315_02160, partial [Gammaproteobacteria bacterium]
MTVATLGLTAGFVFIVVLLLVLNLRTNYHWLIKLGTILLALGFYLIILHALPGFYGWPTRESLPQKFRLVSMEIIEPRHQADAGVIYIWASSLDENDTRPRAYELPYSTELHTRLTQARKRMEFGQTMAGELEADAE